MSAAAVRRVVHLDTGREWRGGQAQVHMLIRGLRRHGVESMLLAPDAPLLRRARAAGVMAEPWDPRFDLDLGAGFAARGMIGAWKPDVVHAHTARAHALGVPAARIARVPAVVVSRRVAMPVRGGLLGLKYRMSVDRYLCVSRGVLETMAKGGVPRERLVVVPSGIEPAPSSSIDVRGLLGVASDTPLIGTAAALTAEKRHRDLLEAFSLVVASTAADVHMVWLGEGPLRESLERQARALGLEKRVHLLGFREDARVLIAQCTMAALASDSEGIATTLIEAQDAGVPVVATAVGGVPEVVQDRVTGRLVPPRDPRAMAGALTELLNSPEARAAMGRAGKQAAQEFHIDRTVERTLDAYRSALGASRSSS